MIKKSLIDIARFVVGLPAILACIFGGVIIAATALKYYQGGSSINPMEVGFGFLIFAIGLAALYFIVGRDERYQLITISLMPVYLFFWILIMERYAGHGEKGLFSVPLTAVSAFVTGRLLKAWYTQKNDAPESTDE